MTDPTRWTDKTGEATTFEQELLRAGQAVALPTEHRRRIWETLARECPPLPPPLEGSSSAAGTAGTATTAAVPIGPVATGLLVLATLGGLTGLGYLAIGGGELESRPAASSTATPAIVRQVETRPTGDPSALTGKAATRPPAPVSPSATDGVVERAAPAATTSRETRLREEAAVVLQARRRLRAGDAAGALQLLERARSRFPHGGLEQEREALVIEALAQSGSTEAAQQRGREFLRTYPRSPHAADVRAATER